MDLIPNLTRLEGLRMGRRWKLLLVSLLIASIIIQLYSVYAYATAEERNSILYYCYMVEPLDYVPGKYWNLTDPDQYILEAIENPGRWTEPFHYKDSTFWFTAIWDNPEIAPPGPHCIQPTPFKYNGTYYTYHVVYPSTRLWVYLLSEEPEEYWNLTNPDKYLLEGIENPGKMIVVGIYSNVSAVLGAHNYKPFYYNGHYYDYKIGEVDYGYPLPTVIKPEHTAAVLSGIWIMTGSIYFTRKKKKENTASSMRGFKSHL